MKLEDVDPAENERESDDLEHILHSTAIPAPPGPNVEGTEPSVQMVTSEVGSDCRCEVAVANRTLGGSVGEHRGIEVSIEKSVELHGAQGGHM